MTDNGNFTAGDTIIIRFRMYSDELSAGWGWAIDNLRIQIPTANGQVPEMLAKTSVYPNPFNDEITIGILSEKGLKNVTANIYNSYGQLVKSHSAIVSGNNYSEKLKVADLGTGIYIIKIMADDALVETRKLIKNR